ncbi:hypothetical protein ACQ858_08365 [Variovorax ureilyticus]|uniref:hypothetical protein n=1 Tax=Variovorax ureilyticus TaxID=1836198 RepID=UPI003D66BB1E
MNADDQTVEREDLPNTAAAPALGAALIVDKETGVPWLMPVIAIDFYRDQPE